MLYIYLLICSNSLIIENVFTFITYLVNYKLIMIFKITFISEVKYVWKWYSQFFSSLWKINMRQYVVPKH